MDRIVFICTRLAIVLNSEYNGVLANGSLVLTNKVYLGKELFN